MAYLLLIMERSEGRRRWSEAEGVSKREQMLRWGDGLRARGVLRASESLRPDTEGVRIALDGAKRLVTEGPFAESKEIVGGFFLLDVETKAQALAIPNQCPALHRSTVDLQSL
jgi:hypothetical protein